MIVTYDPSVFQTSSSHGSVVSLGVFDGVHLGHQAILRANVERARELSATPTVVTFSGHPKKILLGHAPRTLTTLDHRLELFQRAGIEHTLALEFNEALRQTTAEEFAQGLLAEKLGAKSFILGFDSKFGCDRRGTPELLTKLGYPVEVVEKVVVGGRAVSSTAIREAVELGDLEGAARMLGRRVSVYGQVVHGAELGRQLGFPTANLNLHHELHPPPGVYACHAHLSTDENPAETTHAAACNIGFRPTIEGKRPDKPLVEVHIIDYEGELYDAFVEVEFVSHLRGEMQFSGLDELRSQIDADVRRAREILSVL